MGIAYYESEEELVFEIADLKEQNIVQFDPWKIILLKIPVKDSLLRKRLTNIFFEELINLKGDIYNFLKVYLFKNDIARIKYNLKNWEKIFNGDVIFLHKFEVNDTGSLLEKTCELLKSQFVLEHSEKEDVFRILKDELNTFKESQEKKLEVELVFEFVSNFLKRIEFPVADALTQLFRNFKDVENQLMISFKGYKEHISHSFRVFLLGLNFLIIERVTWKNIYDDILIYHLH